MIGQSFYLHNPGRAKMGHCLLLVIRKSWSASKAHLVRGIVFEFASSGTRWDGLTCAAGFARRWSIAGAWICARFISLRAKKAVRVADKPAPDCAPWEFVVVCIVRRFLAWYERVSARGRGNLCKSVMVLRRVRIGEAGVNRREFDSSSLPIRPILRDEGALVPRWGLRARTKNRAGAPEC